MRSTNPDSFSKLDIPQGVPSTRYFPELPVIRRPAHVPFVSGGTVTALRVQLMIAELLNEFARGSITGCLRVERLNP